MSGNETQETAKPLLNKRAPGASYYVPLTEPFAGAILSTKDFPQNKKAPLLFKPLKIRGVTFKNRAWVSPMCQYSCETGTGVHSDWHLVHLGSFARGGAGLVMVEASAVLPNGMISPEDSGIWGEEHIPPLKRTVEFGHTQGAVMGIQIAHAGRKGSTYAPWLKDALVHPSTAETLPKHATATDNEGGWRTKVIGPSAIPFDDDHATPVEQSEAEIKEYVQAYVAAAKRAEKAGFDLVEIHGAHGYLVHNYLSPVSNKRTDSYGGSLENRLRCALEIAEAVRAVVPAHKPVFFRVSASDWHPDGEKNAQGEYISWGIEQTIELVKRLQDLGVDLIDVSSGGNYSGQKIDIGPSYQAHFARDIKKAVPKMLVGTVGLLTSAKQIEDHLQNGDADAAFLAREFLRDPHFPYTAAQDLGVAVSVPVQYERAFTRMYKEHA